MLSHIRHTLLMLLLSLALAAQASRQPSFYMRWNHLPTEQLMQMAVDYERRPLADSAIVCYTIVANRYASNLSREQKRQCAEAYIRMWRVYFLAYLDYPKSYECLSHAQDICHELGIEMPRIDLDLGGMYTTIADICDDPTMNRKAFDAFRKAFRAAYAGGYQEDMNVAFANLVSRAFIINFLDSIGREWKQFSATTFTTAKEYAEFNRLMYLALEQATKKDYPQALTLLRRQLGVMPLDGQHVRYICQTHINIGMVYAHMGDYGQAIRAIDEVRQLTDSFHLSDIRIELMKTLWTYHSANGDRAQAQQAQHQYLLLKDSLLNYQQLKNMSSLDFLTQLKKVDLQIAEGKRKRQAQNMIIVGIAIIAAITAGFLFVVYRKNRTLTRNNESLYKKNVELLQVETLYKEMRSKQNVSRCEERRPPLLPPWGATNVSAQKSNVAPTGAEGGASTPPLPAPRSSKQSPRPAEEKYRGSTLGEETKAILLDKIQSVMEQSEEIFSPDFTVERLASLVDSRGKVVSQVINEKYDFNFNTLLGNYRIKEALRRIADEEHYGNYSVEGISTSVGFRSRTSFRTTFKRVTGLTPSDYIRIQRAQKA